MIRRFPALLRAASRPGCRNRLRQMARATTAAALALILTAGPALAQDNQAAIEAAAQKDVLLSAMLAELERTRELKRMPGIPPLYYAGITVEDADNYSVTATLGSIFQPQSIHMRPVNVSMRVGDMKFDNTGSVFSDGFDGTHYDSESLPIENNLLALRNALWLSTDYEFKSAVQAYGQKQAALRGVTVNEPLPDFSAAPPTVLIQEPKRTKVDETAWNNRVRTLSGLFKKYPDITGSSVDFQVAQSTFYFVNTEGTALRTPDRAAILRIRATMQATDGTPLHNAAEITAEDTNGMPAETALTAAADGVAQELMSISKAPKGEAYTGPVLFEPKAGAQIFGEIFGSQLPVTRPLVTPPGRPSPALRSDLESRIGSRVLPDGFSMVDDPTLAKWNGQTLTGGYPADIEGVRAQRTSLVENGVLKTLLTTRQPVRGVPQSNGHARLPSELSGAIPRISNLLVETKQTTPFADMKTKMLEMIKQQGKPYGMLVRKMDFPSSTSFDEFRRSAMRMARSGGGRPLSAPLLVYRVYPDGREELVRGVRFHGLAIRAFRDILAASSEQALFQFVDNGLPTAVMGAGSYFVNCSVVAPGLLFEELELEASDDDQPRLPIVPPPSLSMAAQP